VEVFLLGSIPAGVLPFFASCWRSYPTQNPLGLTAPATHILGGCSPVISSTIAAAVLLGCVTTKPLSNAYLTVSNRKMAFAIKYFDSAGVRTNSAMNTDYLLHIGYLQHRIPTHTARGHTYIATI
jgi:hypothetical protein